MKPPNDAEVKRGISVLWETLQCPICLDLLIQPVSTKCDHQFCKFCLLKLLDNTKLSRADCPVCKEKITKRSLHESPGFQRLVTGLQDMIQAYERDTGTNYFTGLAQEGRRSLVSNDKGVDGTANSAEGVEKTLPSSHSSTIAALDGFARVMGIEDSNPLTTDGGVQDGSLGGSNEISEPIEATSRLVTPRKGRKDQVVPAVSKSQPCRQKRKKNEEPEQISENRKKESVEKVAEWLMKVPAEESLKLEERAEVAHVTDDSDSSASTLDVKNFNKKVQSTKTLENKVFGATYKRDRRSNRSTSTKPLSHSTEKPPKKKKKMTTSLTPSDFTKSPEGNCENYLNVSATMDVSEEAGNCEIHKKDPDKPSERDENNSKGDSLSRETLQPERKRRKRLISTLQQVDSDLRAKAQRERSAPKKADRRKGPSQKGKSARALNPLVLVGVQNQDRATESKLPAESVQVHIENYPSSEDQEAPVTTGARRSRRLQLSFQNVPQRAPKKAATRQEAKAHGKDVKDGERSDFSEVNACKINGCVYDKNICVIENMELSRLENLVQGVPPVETNAGTDPDPHLVPGNASPIGGAPENPAPRSSQSSLAEKEEDRNDSEVDIDQLLRSFNTTKRKSFRLTRSMTNRRVDEAHVQSPDKSSPTTLQDPSTKQQSTDLANPSSLSDLIPPTDLPKRKVDVDGAAALVLLRSTVSSALSPNKVTTREAESPLVSLFPQVVDSGLCFYERQEIAESVVESSPKEHPRDLIENPTASGNQLSPASQHLLNTDSSLTPDGLGLRPAQSPHGTQTSIQSSIQSVSGRRTLKRTRRLQSSSESQSSPNKVLPTLAQNFHEVPQGGCVQDGAEADGQEVKDVSAGCSDPDCIPSSQASVDLFDPPDECDVAINGTSVSVESSQFTSEVLLTQQKLEMKKELEGLWKLMTVVSEVLQEKEANPAVCPEVHKSIPRGPDCPDWKAREGDEEPRRCPRDGEELAQPTVELSSPGLAGKSVADSTLTSKDRDNKTRERDSSRAEMVLVSSGLARADQIAVKRFAKSVGARVVSRVTAEVTHIVMCTDEHLVCERTLKYFLGIAGRKWVVSFQWIAECFKRKKLLDESLFEVRGDVVNGSDHLGPMRARTTSDDNLLMKGYEICFQGPFTDMTTEEMEWMAQLCGAAVAKDPLLLDSKQKSKQLVIVQPGSEPCSYSSLAKQATVVTRGWLLDSVATYTLQGYDNYLTIRNAHGGRVDQLESFGLTVLRSRVQSRPCLCGVGVFSPCLRGHFGFLPHPKKHPTLIGHSKLPLGVIVSVAVCLDVPCDWLATRSGCTSASCPLTAGIGSGTHRDPCGDKRQKNEWMEEYTPVSIVILPLYVLLCLLCSSVLLL
ncbi:breast cancer type 1 susceptibility protein homolog isoform X2 [Syngnathoides biaculeatus]|uniref:breast cancer type 1 susceptibility protein homolog isoform X2 n=1 Tax=Syngnathoides biaculeatus TaxID=300417 RepID=UPI002ADE8BF8|nr:breast cancer type 1 susceptibility protein homolog isoform X2 [Syngnathoides biaculeatus]